MKIYRVAIAGYGVVGKRRASIVESLPNLKLVCVCDSAFVDTSKKVDGLNCFTDYLEMIDNELIDILFVCLTNDINAEVTKAGLERGMHVFCEKPPGRDVRELLSVIEVEKRHPSLKLMYGFNHRHHHSIREALAIINSGDLGPLLNLRGIYGKSKLITFDQTDWRTKRDVAGGGVLLDQGIHMLDLMRLFAGEFHTVKSIVKNTYWGFDVEDNAYALMESASGVIAMLHSSATEWQHRFNLELNLEKGSLCLGGLLTGSKSYGEETLTIYRRPEFFANSLPATETKVYRDDPSWLFEIEYFIDMVDKAEPIAFSSSTDALNTMRLVFSVYWADENWRNSYGIKLN